MDRFGDTSRGCKVALSYFRKPTPRYRERDPAFSPPSGVMVALNACDALSVGSSRCAQLLLDLGSLTTSTVATRELFADVLRHAWRTVETENQPVTATARRTPKLYLLEGGASTFGSITTGDRGSTPRSAH